MFKIYINLAIETPTRWLFFIQYLSYIVFFVPPLYGLIIFLGRVLPATIIKKLKQRIMKEKKTQNNDTLLNRFEYCCEGECG